MPEALRYITVYVGLITFTVVRAAPLGETLDTTNQRETLPLYPTLIADFDRF